MGISRRSFIGTTALGGLAASSGLADSGAKTTLPTRVLGRTGRSVSILAFGCGSRYLMYDEEQGIAALNRAIDLGITYVDTAYAYGNGKSEARVGQVMKTRRNEVFLATKVPDRDGDKAMRTIEDSLKRLQTDHVDLLHVHGLQDEKDLAAAEAKDGVINLLYKLRDQKVARAIGVTCHTDPAALKAALEHNDFDCTQMALNAALAGMINTPAAFEANLLAPASFQSIALPVAQRKKMGVIAMKVFAQDYLKDKASPDKILRYSMSLPVTTAVVGMPKVEMLEANVAVARSFQPLPASEMQEISSHLSQRHKASIDHFFMHHTDA